MLLLAQARASPDPGSLNTTTLFETSTDAPSGHGSRSLSTEDHSIMNLMTLIRLVALLAIAWVLVALGAGILGVGADSAGPPTYFSWSSSPQDAVAVIDPDDLSREEYRLVDRTTGRIEPLLVPPDEKWGLLSVSPWRDQEGELEAAGRWVSRVDGSEKPAFCGVGLFRLSDGAVLDRISLDVLPTGRPCWVPNRPRELLFPAGDGRLHRCHLGGGRGDGTVNGFQESRGHNRRSARAIRPVTWHCQRPGAGEAYLADPEWSSDPRLHRYVIVALRRQRLERGKKEYEPSKIWWLQMSAQADGILAAGRLTVPGSSLAADDSPSERFPSVSAGSEGGLTLVYLARLPQSSSWQLCRTALEFDPKTGAPKLALEPAAAEVLGAGLAPSPVIPLTDGRSVYASAAAGQIVKYPEPASR
jgi:hypothetical protein